MVDVLAEDVVGYVLEAEGGCCVVYRVEEVDGLVALDLLEYCGIARYEP